MLLEILIISVVVLFIVFFFALGKEWYAPYTLFMLPFIGMLVVALFNKANWGLQFELTTFFVLFVGILFFLMGCWVAKFVRIQTLVHLKPLVMLQPSRRSINNNKLFIVDILMLIFFLIYFNKIYTYGVENEMSFTEAINYIMMLAKFEPDKTTITIPFILQIFLQINYLAAYLYSFFIARRIIYKDRSNLALLLFGYILSMATCFLNGSRGPLVENVIALVLAFAITWHQRYGMKMFPRRILLGIVVLLAIAVIGFFAMLPLLGRQSTAESFWDSITEYIGSQAYNLNYFIQTKDSRSTFFAANTFSSLYNDLETLGITIGHTAGKIKTFFVTANGHEMGNVFTCFFSFYVDFGITGVAIFSYLIGWISQRIYEKIKLRSSIVDFALVIYIYIGVNLMFCFFGNRFYDNVFQIKSLLKFIWLYLIFWFVSDSNIAAPFQTDGILTLQGII